MSTNSGRKRTTETKRSAPTTWVGKAIQERGTRVYYGACQFENEVYRVWDAVLLNSDTKPFPIGRIVSMWEQAKKKWLTINWFYRASDLVRIIQEKQKAKKLQPGSEADITLDKFRKSGSTENEENGDTTNGIVQSATKNSHTTNNSNHTLHEGADELEVSASGELDICDFLPEDQLKSLKHSLQNDDDAILKDTLEFLSSSPPQEIFVSNHQDQNYPSTLKRKITVQHVDEIEDLTAFCAKRTCLFYRKNVDLATIQLKDAEKLPPPAPTEVIDYDPNHPRRRREPSKRRPDSRKRPLSESSDGRASKRKRQKISADSWYSEDAVTRGDNGTNKIFLKRSFVDARARARANTVNDTTADTLIDAETNATLNPHPNRNISIHEALQAQLANIHMITEKGLALLERVITEQQRVLMQQLSTVENLQTNNNKVCDGIYNVLKTQPAMYEQIRQLRLQDPYSLRVRAARERLSRSADSTPVKPMAIRTPREGGATAARSIVLLDTDDEKLPQINGNKRGEEEDESESEAMIIDVSSNNSSDNNSINNNDKTKNGKQTSDGILKEKNGIIDLSGDTELLVVGDVDELMVAGTEAEDENSPKSQNSTTNTTTITTTTTASTTATTASTTETTIKATTATTTATSTTEHTKLEVSLS